ncbi:MAG: transglutaminase domain-containing protein [Spirochaetota bacterium]
MKHKGPPVLSTVIYSLSIGIFLIHIQLLLVPIGHPIFFIVSLLAAFAIGIGKRRWTPLILLVFPWLVKILVLLMSLIAPAKSISFDQMLLFFDHNFLAALLPFYWMGLSTFMAGISFKALHWNRICNSLLVLVFFLLIRSRQFTFYVWPTAMLVVFALIIILQFVSLMLASPRQSFPLRRTIGSGLFLLLFLGILSIIVLRKPAEEQATEQGGGLIKPDLFRFDFSQFLRLESEISLKEDLVLIVHKDQEDSHILIRRYILSGYDTKKGFYREPVKDEAEHPQELPASETILSSPTWQARRTTEQEYFLINFDPSAFIAMNSPRSISPLKTWDTTSFSSAYRVQSETSEVMPFELIDAVPYNKTTVASLGLSEQEYLWYTNYGNDQRIKALGDQLTEGLETYWEKIQAIYEYLKHGDYRYSLKPGLASDGDQLGRFLFTTKKGYCSYFAFSMALLLRSQGVPARVAVGFFIDPDTGAFNYYPILSNMAHAWVEVYFPSYGWIEYDPTTSILAEGETFRFSQGVQQQTFERLLGEILQNRDKLALVNQQSPPETQRGISELFGPMGHWFIHKWPIIALLLYIIGILLFRNYYACLSWYHRVITHKFRLTATYRFKHSLRILCLSGVYKPHHVKSRSLQEQIQQIEASYGITLLPLFTVYQEARFASPDYPITVDSILRTYEVFMTSYKKKVPLLRRLTAQVFPFITMILPCKGSWPKLVGILLLVTSLFQSQANMTAQNQGAQEILSQAQKLREEERWEQVISLLQRAESLYPLDSRFPAELGDIYNTRGLYNLAWNAYRRAEIIDPENSELWYQLSYVAGRLNKNEESIQYLQRILAKNPDNRDAIGDLGWMYFKTHRLSEGERLLTESLDRFGPDQGLEMTLATIYSDQYRYEDAKTYYLKAIKHAEKSGFKLFLAVAYYNLSILESRFYRYADAFNSTHLSLQYTERASGHLARGELYQRRLDFTKAHGEYLAAYELDTSPLSKINMAQLYQQAGNLTDAKTYAENTLQQSDLSWMINYGTDIDRYKKDLHQILYDTYRGLANEEHLRYKANLWQEINSLIGWMQYRFQQIWQEQLLTYYTLEAADAYGVENQKLDALIHYYLALQRYPWRAKPYLEEAMKYETSLIEASRPTYLYEMGKLEQKAELILQAINQFDPVWERDMIADAYAELAKIYQNQGKIDESQASIEALYALNRGALLQRGCKLPINLEIQGNFVTASEQAGYRRAITAIVSHSGLQILTSKESRFRLIIIRQSDGIRAELRDTLKGAVLRERTIAIPNLTSESRQRISLELQKTLFSELGQ